MNQVNAGRIDKNFLLAALYNQARPLSELHVMGTDEAGEIVSEREQTVKGPHIPVAGRVYYFDTIKGRKIEVDLAPGQIDGTRYDKRYGKGACYEAVNAARINQH
jgi:hypothetical protein